MPSCSQFFERGRLPDYLLGPCGLRGITQPILASGKENSVSSHPPLPGHSLRCSHSDTLLTDLLFPQPLQNNRPLFQNMYCCCCALNLFWQSFAVVSVFLWDHVPVYNVITRFSQTFGLPGFTYIDVLLISPSNFSSFSSQPALYHCHAVVVRFPGCLYTVHLCCVFASPSQLFLDSHLPKHSGAFLLSGSILCKQEG